MKCRRPHNCRVYSTIPGRAPLTERPYLAASWAGLRPSSADGAGRAPTATAPLCVVSLTVDTFVLKVRAGCRGIPGLRLMLSGPSFSDDRGSAQPGQPPDRAPAHGSALATRRRTALTEAADPCAQRP